MRLPAIREKISQLPRLYRYLFLLSLVLIVVISIEASYFFYLNYHRRSIPEQGDKIVGTVIEKKGNLFTIEDDRSVKVNVEITGRVLYGGGRETGNFNIVDSSNIKIGQHLILTKLGPDSNLRKTLKNDVLVQVWD